MESIPPPKETKINIDQVHNYFIAPGASMSNKPDRSQTISASGRSQVVMSGDGHTGDVSLGRGTGRKRWLMAIAIAVIGAAGAVVAALVD